MSKASTVKKCLLSFVLVLVVSVATPLTALAEEVAPDTVDTSTPAPSEEPSSSNTTTPDTQTTTSPSPDDISTTNPTPGTASPASTPENSPSPTQEAQTGATNTGASDTGASTTGPSEPNGDAAATYTFNTVTGLWENDYYTWDPVTHITTPKTAQTYSYNPTTGRWDTTEWQYNAATGEYEPNTVYSTVGNLAALLAATPNTQDPNSPLRSSAYNNFYNAAISNNLTSTALSGDATILGNTFAGSAATGDALAVATVINLLQSASSFGGGSVGTFTLNLQGDQTGDVLLNPNALGQLAVSQAVSPISSLTVNSQSNGSINNNVSVGAGSGSALVAENSAAGNASSGDANAVANIINVLNSAIGAGQSFVGTINILGNLDGDILLPQGLLSLLATNAPNSAVTATNTGSSHATASIDNNSAILNNVLANAITGDATIANNTSAGNATSGNALSNITVLNMTGSEVIGANNLLVFVNVLGKWVGMIVNAPGATAASLGGGITQNTTHATSTDINASSNNTITNDINVNAASGDATIANNTSAGNATTGDATSSVNLANFINTHLSLSEWFGVLFINVFGSWTGWFGQDTAAGTKATSSQSTTTAQSSKPAVVVYQFTPAGTNDSGTQRYALVPASEDVANPTIKAVEAAAVMASTTPSDGQDKPLAAAVASTNNKKGTGLPTAVFPAIGVLVAAILLAVERLTTLRQRRTNNPLEQATVQV